MIEAQANDEAKCELATQVMNIAEPITFGFEIIRWLRTEKSRHESNSAISPNGLLKVSNALANRIEILFNQDVAVFEKYPDYATRLLKFWRDFGSKENADKYLTEFLNADIQNVHKLLDSIVSLAYPMDGSPPHKSDFERDEYNYLQSFVDLNMVYELLKTAYGDKLESEQYPYNFGAPLDLSLAKQFAWIHKKVLIEKQNFERGSSGAEIKPE